MGECEAAELQSGDIYRGDRRPDGRLAARPQGRKEEGVVGHSNDQIVSSTGQTGC